MGAMVVCSLLTRLRRSARQTSFHKQIYSYLGKDAARLEVVRMKSYNDEGSAGGLRQCSIEAKTLFTPKIPMAVATASAWLLSDLSTCLH